MFQCFAEDTVARNEAFEYHEMEYHLDFLRKQKVKAQQNESSNIGEKLGINEKRNSADNLAQSQRIARKLDTMTDLGTSSYVGSQSDISMM